LFAGRGQDHHQAIAPERRIRDAQQALFQPVAGLQAACEHMADGIIRADVKHVEIERKGLVVAHQHVHLVIGHQSGHWNGFQIGQARRAGRAGLQVDIHVQGIAVEGATEFQQVLHAGDLGQRLGKRRGQLVWRFVGGGDGGGQGEPGL